MIVFSSLEIEVPLHLANKWATQMNEVWRHIIVSTPNEDNLVTISCFE